MQKSIPIGIEFYKKMIDGGYYYVDKTLLIKDLLDNGSAVNLFTRPRRFGKTLALSMLKAYFEDARDSQGAPIDNRHYFAGKKIVACGEKYTAKMGQYPTIHLSLKSAKQPTYEMAYPILADSISEEFRRHWYVHESGALFADEAEKFQDIMERKAAANDYATSLAFLSKCLQRFHKRNVVILIDEYDVPLENAYFEGFYGKMAAFIRSLFESALKTNDSLEFAVITGCLRISKESIFNGLNNLKANSILSDAYAGYYGFTPAEVSHMLADYGLEDCMDEARLWYDGYLFGKQEVYNPWSILNYVDEKCCNKAAYPKPYWSNTSSNSIIRELVEKAGLETKQELEALLAGGSIEKPLHEEITYGDIYESQDNLWNFLFFTGYLKKTGAHREGRTIYLRLAMPNEEIASIYENTILAWFEKKAKTADLSALLQAIENGDCEAFGNFISQQLQESISFFDYGEAYYHGFLLGLLKGTGKYLVTSNRESGNGRPDIVMQSPSVCGKAFILELKTAKEYAQMSKKCEEAIAQSLRENYPEALRQIGFSDIGIYGISFYRKECLVKACREVCTARQNDVQ